MQNLTSVYHNLSDVTSKLQTVAMFVTVVTLSHMYMNFDVTSSSCFFFFFSYLPNRKLDYDYRAMLMFSFYKINYVDKCYILYNIYRT
jgi:hypothetical protein